MGVVGLERSFFCFFESKNEVATEKIVVDLELVLHGNGLGGICLGECNCQFGECAAGFPIVGADFDSWRFGAALAVAESGACLERELFPCGFDASLPLGGAAVFASLEAGHVKAWAQMLGA